MEIALNLELIVHLDLERSCYRTQKEHVIRRSKIFLLKLKKSLTLGPQAS